MKVLEPEGSDTLRSDILRVAMPANLWLVADRLHGDFENLCGEVSSLNNKLSSLIKIETARSSEKDIQLIRSVENLSDTIEEIKSDIVSLEKRLERTYANESSNSLALKVGSEEINLVMNDLPFLTEYLRSMQKWTVKQIPVLEIVKCLPVSARELDSKQRPNRLATNAELLISVFRFDLTIEAANDCGIKIPQLKERIWRMARRAIA